MSGFGESYATADVVPIHGDDCRDRPFAPIDPVDMDLDPPGSSAQTLPARRVISATLYAWRNPEELPRRAWVYARLILRKGVFVIIAPGAVGKTTMITGIGLSLVTGRDLLGQPVWGGPKRVWIWNLEDPLDELAKSIQAAASHWGIAERDIDGRLFVDCGLEGATLQLVRRGPQGHEINAETFSEIVAVLRHREIDVLIVDPFVSSHGLADENDNVGMDLVCKAWARIAVEANCAIGLAHHARKSNGEEITVESSRGASSLTDAARSGLVLNRMQKAQAEEFAIEEVDRRRYFRADDAKPNRAPPGSGQWFEILSVHLGNGPDGGDSIGVATPWRAPDPFDDVRPDDLRRVESRIDERGWRESPQAADWFGKLVAEELGLDLDTKLGKAKVRSIIRTWIGNGAFKVEERQDGRRETRKFIVLGKARP